MTVVITLTSMPIVCPFIRDREFVNLGLVWSCLALRDSRYPIHILFVQHVKSMPMKREWIRTAIVDMPNEDNEQDKKAVVK